MFRKHSTNFDVQTDVSHIVEHTKICGQIKKQENTWKKLTREIKKKWTQMKKEGIQVVSGGNENDS